MKLNDLAVEFLAVTIPYYAANPEWRKIFNEIADLGEENRDGIIEKLNRVTGPLLGFPHEEQISEELDFIRLSIEDPTLPRMMVKLIDLENRRVQKNNAQEATA